MVNSATSRLPKRDGGREPATSVTEALGRALVYADWMRRELADAMDLATVRAEDLIRMIGNLEDDGTSMLSNVLLVETKARQR